MFIKKLILISNRRFYSSKKSSLPTNPILPKKIKNEQKKTSSQYFVDYKVTNIKAGHGGDGIVSFMHLKGNEWAGPDGGDGGNGGHVIFEVDPGLKSLNKINSMYKAENGSDGKAYNMKGKNGSHLLVKIPNKTVFKNKLGEVVFEMNTEKNSKMVLARGGAGGKGNYYFLSNENRMPQQFEPGHKGEQFEYHIELKLIADAALIGIPNAGKSSLLNALTRARAKIGDYSFTTIHPMVGCVEYEDYLQISIADLPGLLPDLTSGFGTRYLHHLERCKIIIFVLDFSKLSVDLLQDINEEPFMQYLNMKNVLDSYDPSLLMKKSSIIIAHKIDQILFMSIDKKIDEFKTKLYNYYKNDGSGLNNRNIPPIIPVSARDKINLNKFLKLLRNIYEYEVKNKE